MYCVKMTEQGYTVFSTHPNKRRGGITFNNNIFFTESTKGSVFTGKHYVEAVEFCKLANHRPDDIVELKRMTSQQKAKLKIKQIDAFPEIGLKKEDGQLNNIR